MAVRQDWNRGLFAASPEGDEPTVVQAELLTVVTRAILTKGLHNQAQAFLNISGMGNFLSQQANDFFTPIFRDVLTSEQVSQFESFLNRRDAFRLWQEKLDELSSPAIQEPTDDQPCIDAKAAE